MEESVILHQIRNKKNIAYSVQVVSGDANPTFALFLNSDFVFIIYRKIKHNKGRSNPSPWEDFISEGMEGGGGGVGVHSLHLPPRSAPEMRG